MNWETYLLAGSLKGSLALLLVLGADRLVAGRMQARWRRLWWILIPLVFLLPIPALSVPATWTPAVLVPPAATPSLDSFIHPGIPSILTPRRGPVFSPLLFLWLFGVAVRAAWILIPTLRIDPLWRQGRLSTDPTLLNLLEDSKALAGVTAPVGLVLSDAVPAPALLGWLRPRLLLPRFVVEASSAPELKAIFLHELAHFKMLDIPLGWLFALATVVHWFNPLAYLAEVTWARFREEAADETTIRWQHDSTPLAYGEVLLKTLGHCSGGVTPHGALAIGESIKNLQRRMLMIRTYPMKSARGGLAATLIAGLLALMALYPAPAQDDSAKKDAVAAMQTWLGEMDAGNYAQSWSDAADSFRKAVTSDQWIAVSRAVRDPLGKLISRNLASALHQTSVPIPGGKMLEGDFVIAQFDVSYENLKSGLETVTFEKDAQGAWKASGYYIKPST
jgi:beta-lactamase regulating signal transducer with metallopeptidase domain